MQLMHISKYAQGTNLSFYSQELLSEERELFAIIQSINELIQYESQYTSYFNCLINMIVYDANEPHSEPIARKAMELITILVKTSCYPVRVVQAIIPPIFSKVYA